MPTPDNWLSLEFWTKSTEGLNHLALIVGGTIGIVLLAIRTFAANRSANASLEQAKAANKSARAALEQAKVAVAQAKTAAERHEEQTRADRERRITESFAKAVEQLGSDKLETRLGGIYTLERIAGESAREYWPIMGTLTAFVRARAPWPLLGNPFVELQGSTDDETAGESTPAKQPKDATKQRGVQIRPATDIQATLTVLGSLGHDEKLKQDQAAKRRLDLMATDLRGANLAGAYLKGAILFGAHLDRADLSGAHLQGAGLAGAYLQGANLFAAYLQGARFQGMRQEDADFILSVLGPTTLSGVGLSAVGLRQEQLEWTFGDDRTRLPEGLTRPVLWTSAKSWAAKLQGVGLTGVDLRVAKNLTQEQLNAARGDERTTLPEGLVRPAHWSAAPPTEGPEAPDNAE